MHEIVNRIFVYIQEPSRAPHDQPSKTLENIFKSILYSIGEFYVEHILSAPMCSYIAEGLGCS